MSYNQIKMSRSRMIDLLTKLALMLDPYDEPIELVCVGGGALILFDEKFEWHMSTDIDAYLLDLSNYDNNFKFLIDEVAYQEEDDLGHDWLNDDIAEEGLEKEIDLDEFIEYLDEDNQLIFYNSHNEVAIILTPVTTEIVIIAKMLSNRFKDIAISRTFAKIFALNNIAEFDQYFQNNIPSFVDDNRYVYVLVKAARNIYEDDLDDILDYLEENNYDFIFEEVEEKYNEEAWGDPIY